MPIKLVKVNQEEEQEVVKPKLTLVQERSNPNLYIPKATEYKESYESVVNDYASKLGSDTLKNLRNAQSRNAGDYLKGISSGDFVDPKR